uniref:hypothetical protein n=1 Tax=Pandoraea pnomenusa TaxID=93220 RepID=UPI00118497CC|nr:hypothetical protein [Pandoraea pnomenusa]
MRIGGWTRIWLVISASALAIAALDGYENWGRAKTLAITEREANKSFLAECEKFTAPVVDRNVASSGAAQSLDEWLGKARVEDCSASRKIDPEVRYSEDVRVARERVLLGAAQTWLWPTVLVGLVFAAVGWIRRGFAKAS